MTMLLNAVAFIRHRQGIYPIAVIDFEEKVVRIYTTKGTENIAFADVGNIDFETNIPILIVPN